MTFRVHPYRKRARGWVLVRVFGDAPVMRATVRRECRERGISPRLARDAEGVCQQGRPGMEAATVNVHRRRLTVEVLSHEFLHAAFNLGDRAERGVIPNARPGDVYLLQTEEALCQAQSRMLWRCIDRLRRMKIVSAEGLFW